MYPDNYKIYDKPAIDTTPFVYDHDDETFLSKTLGERSLE